jgi:hypothetical protein
MGHLPRNRLDFSVVRDLTDADLKDLGVVLGSAKRWAYSDLPSFSSQSAICCDRRKTASGTWVTCRERAAGCDAVRDRSGY